MKTIEKMYAAIDATSATMQVKTIAKTIAEIYSAVEKTEVPEQNIAISVEVFNQSNAWLEENAPTTPELKSLAVEEILQLCVRYTNGEINSIQALTGFTYGHVSPSLTNAINTAYPGVDWLVHADAFAASLVELLTTWTGDRDAYTTALFEEFLPRIIEAIKSC